MPGFGSLRQLQRNPEPSPAPGYGEACGHHGEILQGAVAAPGGAPRPVLVTLPCRRFRAVARFFPRPGAPLAVRPGGRTKAARAARLALASLERPALGGVLILSGAIPLRQGLGSSSADVTAAIRAVAAALGRNLPPERIARLAVAAEVAADPLMFEDAAVVFAQREGIVVERFDRPLPAMEILGVRDPANGSGIDTLTAAPPGHDRRDLRYCAALLERLRDGIARGDAEAVAAVATLSARRNQRHLAKPRLAALEAIGRHHGALGVQVAHSGTVMGLLFRPGHRDAIRETRRALARRGWNLGTYLIPAGPTVPAPNAEREIRLRSA